ncbi:isotrichodermin C-15 hydroxylase (cytochrome P-450 monooxygenase CYP65A1) [Fusarium agapanthi]|uniref:Isotrichodermin C-15 hydroxylase (Cytochrome P-450 monooxygenase CYP65A1) n=1 Tax=Fusarium agapanthi TaxID=1803897 RepID=A0A9P5EH62_9HYPO|nr:isotrichodermin C-15 hydroxylase (cytochrome P-450 monooxygenase CYP65A1) [Fusarium agapanthi]
MRFAPNDISFITADAAKIIHGHKGHPVKDIVTAGHEDHKCIRRHLAHAFSTKVLRDYDSILNHYTDKFISELRQRAGTNIDMVAWFNYDTFDIMSHLSLGQPFGCLDTDHYHPWITLLLTSIKFFSFVTVIARLGLVHWTHWLIPTNHDKTLKNDLQFVDRAASTRFNTGDTKNSDIMSHILNHDDENGMTKAEILENAGLLVAASSETTATLMSGTTYYLLMNPDKYNTLVNEIRSTFKSEDEITLPRINQLQHLLAVLNEGLRIYPPSASGLARITLAGGKSIEGYWIPENPFSVGPRDCIGKSFAYTETRVLLTRLLWKFDLELLPESKDWIVQKVYFLYEKPAIHVKMTEVFREKPVDKSD